MYPLPVALGSLNQGNLGNIKEKIHTLPGGELHGVQCGLCCQDLRVNSAQSYLMYWFVPPPPAVITLYTLDIVMRF